MKIEEKDNLLIIKGFDFASCIVLVAMGLILFWIGILSIDGVAPKVPQIVNKIAPFALCAFGLCSLGIALGGLFSFSLVVSKSHLKSKFLFWVYEARDLPLSVRGTKDLKINGWMLFIGNKGKGASMPFFNRKDLVRVAEMVRDYYGSELVELNIQEE